VRIRADSFDLVPDPAAVRQAAEKLSLAEHHTSTQFAPVTSEPGG
jgi:hypothetical protein